MPEDNKNPDEQTPPIENESPTDTSQPVEVRAEETDNTPQPMPIVARGVENNSVDTTEPKQKTTLAKKWIALILLLVIGILAVGGWFVFFRDEKAEVSSTESSVAKEIPRFGVAVGLVEGTVEYSQDSGSTWSLIDVNTELAEGDQVRTQSDGRAVLLIDDGSATRLGFNSSLELTSLMTDSIKVTNLSGETYNRVVTSTTRKYAVLADEQEYTAKGTAFRTYNNDDKKGVEVFHSTVSVDDKNTDVTEGNAFFVANGQKEKENVVSALDITALKSDAFIKWNSELDKKTAEFASALGVLSELDKPTEVPPAPQPTTQTGGIVLSGSVTEYSANFSWKVTGIDTSKGYKLVRSKSSNTPVYPADSAAFIESGKTSYSLYLGDGKTYYFRICAYRGDSCESYSNTVTVTTPLKEVEKPTSGAVLVSLTGNALGWTAQGTAPHGYKIVISADPATPTYGSAQKTSYSGSTSHTVDYLDPGTYNIRVCKYTASEYEGGCMDYSNQVQLIVP